MESIANIVLYILLFTLAGGGLTGWGLIHVSRLPPDNPLRRMLYAVSVRVGVTLGAGAVAIPLQAIPGLDAIYDFGAFFALLWFWLTLIREVRAGLAETRPAVVARSRIEEEAPPAITGKVWVAPGPLSEQRDKAPLRLRR
jgi:hypothetical protein